MAKQLTVRLNPIDKARVSGKLLTVANGTAKALARGNNRAATRAKTESKRIIAGEIALPQKRIAQPMIIHKGNVKDPTSKVVIPSAGLLIGFFSFNSLKSGLYSVKIRKQGGRTKMPKGTYHKPRLRYSKPPKGSLAVPTGQRSKYGYMRGDWLYGPSPSQAFNTKIEDRQFMQIMAELQQVEVMRAVRSLLP